VGKARADLGRIARKVLTIGRRPQFLRSWCSSPGRALTVSITSGRAVVGTIVATATLHL